MFWRTAEARGAADVGLASCIWKGERPPTESRNYEAESGAYRRVKIKTKEWKPDGVRDHLTKTGRRWHHGGPARSSGRKEMVNTTGETDTAGEENKMGTEKASIGESLVSLVKLIPGMNREKEGFVLERSGRLATVLTQDEPLVLTSWMPRQLENQQSFGQVKQPIEINIPDNMSKRFQNVPGILLRCPHKKVTFRKLTSEKGAPRSASEERHLTTYWGEKEKEQELRGKIKLEGVQALWAALGGREVASTLCPARWHSK
ncbi:hypothetical protein P7K49_029687 [Saguinus oedipus]|uniref:Uncharacterized protein n=1 Tax=Saguinus oedipus TaxID=9490 RepID=A0ABQ9U949_SAGOE|nr:hypothetical protein P7K49_029687 [Saguinus oedipus]